ncbi:diguanylate cyclase [Anaerovorax odorimutans]|uniref:diguanylate cyclase n=1 Tax=Anaerovorax odorimutans TaxID=109327 RepID=UPI0003F93181|nr:diguanylate cyclase [Anaerovorax odorimutans]
MIISFEKKLDKVYYNKKKIKSKFLFYKSLVDKSCDSILCLDRTGEYIYVNHVYANLLNKKRTNIIGKNLYDLYSKDEVQKRLEIIKEVFETGNTKVIEHKNYRNDCIIHLITSIKPIRDSMGNIEMVLCISKDITVLKNITNELKEREYILRESQRVARLGSYVVDTKSGIWKCTEELHTIFGIDETYPHNMNGWLKLIHPKWRTKVLKYKAGVDADKLRFDCEYKIIRFNDKKERWVYGLGEFKYNNQGEPVQMIGTIQDITERKRVEEEIIYLSYNDKLTGLYNRRFYEEEIKRLDTERNFPISIIMGDVNGLKLINDAFGHYKGDELLKKVAKVIKNACRSDDIIARWGGDEFVILLPRTDKKEAKQIIDRVKQLCVYENVNDITISISFGLDTKTKKEEDIIKIFKNAEDYMYNYKLLEKESLRSKTIKKIINSLYIKEPREKHHSKRVGELCKNIGTMMGIFGDKLNKIEMSGIFHDIGKIAIAKNVLNNTKVLSEQEKNEIKRHCDIGHRILSSSYSMLELADNIYAHHERWDGKGYPKGLKGEEIPLASRIIAVAESYDIMINDQPYRKALTEKEAVKEIYNNAGTQFDPGIAKIFVEKILNKTWNDNIL